jgi:AraC-like DNA-binding protein
MTKEKNLKKYIRAAIHLVKDSIDKNPGKQRSIKDLAAEANINRNILQYGFKQLFGVKINEYRLRQRMETAKKMLDGGEMSMKQISSTCGYKSPSSFSTAFKRQYKQTPSEWLNRTE